MMKTFRITSTMIDAPALHRELDDPACGACLVFEGRVRNHQDGARVASLTYEAHATLAEDEGAAVIREACERFAIASALAVHRVGSLEIGAVAVWVGVVAGHRDAAYQASRYIIDQLKQRVPIWKKERFTDGTSHWVESGIPRAADAE